jgi:hypothetical protein
MGVLAAAFYHTLILRLPLDYDLQKRGLASRSECANLGAGGRRFKSGRPDHQQSRSTAFPANLYWQPSFQRGFVPLACH